MEREQQLNRQSTTDINTVGTLRSRKKPVFWRLRENERRFILIAGDITVTLLALFIALYFWAARDNWLEFNVEFMQVRPQFWYYLMPVLWLALLSPLYNIRRASHRLDTFRGIITAAGVGLGIYFVIFFLSPKGILPRFGVAVFILVCFLLTMGWRFLYINILTAPQFLRRVLIVGAGKSGTTMAGIVNRIWPPPFHFAGFIDDDVSKIGAQIEGKPVYGGCKDLMRVVRDEDISDLVFAISGEMNPEMFENIMMAEEQGIEVTTMPIAYEELLGRVPIHLLRSDWLLRSFVDQAHAGQLFEMNKRLMDIIGGLIGTSLLIFLSPLIALMIFLDDGSPIIYSQSRLGKNSHPYKILKFRTMRKDAEKDGKAILAVENDNRVTRIGKFLRKSHLDELPQFLNVLKGDMSLVGPRAERPELVNRLQDEVPFYRARLLVKPGLTGWAQINYGYASTTEETAVKLEYDLFYIKHRNLLLDLNILLQTVGTVVGLRGQ
jgi:exopolysaccharide biosynthesis polyprenyl glycosylphosphotransferase